MPFATRLENPPDGTTPVYVITYTEEEAGLINDDLTPDRVVEDIVYEGIEDLRRIYRPVGNQGGE